MYGDKGREAIQRIARRRLVAERQCEVHTSVSLSIKAEQIKIQMYRYIKRLGTRKIRN